jgi:hypothetical protein
MKTKIIILLIIFSAVTLSFSFVNRGGQIDKSINKANKQNLRAEPSGGFVMEDKL